VTRAGSDLLLTWQPPAAGAFDHYDVHRGDLDLLETGQYSHQPPLAGCTIPTPSLLLPGGQSGPADYYLVVAACAVAEVADVSGPFGVASDGTSRPTNRELGLTECP
jgi:hypothetical protein